MHIGISHLRQGRLAQARRIYADARDNLKGRQQARYWYELSVTNLALIAALERPGDDARRRALREALDERGPRFYDGIQTNYALGVDLWQMARKALGDDALTLGGVGVSLVARQEYDRARPALEQALTLAPADWKHREQVQQALDRTR